MKCDRCGEQNAETYHRVNKGIWIVYVCGDCLIRIKSPAVRRACSVHHSTSCGCPETTALDARNPKEETT